MAVEKLVHTVFNTGFKEEIVRRNFKFPHLERINLEWVIKNAKGGAGVDIDNNIILHLHICTEKNRPAHVCYYEATFFYGTYTNKEPFLLSVGAKERETAKELWPVLCKLMDDDYGIHSPIGGYPPATPAVVDVFKPCTHLEAMEYLYKSNCYDFCARLGWALFHPNSIKL